MSFALKFSIFKLQISQSLQYLIIKKGNNTVIYLTKPPPPPPTLKLFELEFLGHLIKIIFF